MSADAYISPLQFLDNGKSVVLQDGVKYSWAVRYFARKQRLVGSLQSEDDHTPFYNGLAMSGDGNTIAVGSQRENDLTGVVYVFTRASRNSLWTQAQVLQSPNWPGASWKFGSVVAISRDGATIAVSEMTDAGVIHVYEKPSATALYAHVAQCVSSIPTDTLGTMMAISGDGSTIVGSCWQRNLVTFKRTSNAWAEVDTRQTSGRIVNGMSLSYDGSVLVYNNYFNDTVHVSVWAAGSWSTPYTMSGPQDSWGFGSSPTILNAAGDVLFVSATGDVNGGNYTGAVYVYKRVPNTGGDTWQFVVKIPAPDQSRGYAYFGEAIACSADGGSLLVGASGYGSWPVYPGIGYVFKANAAKDAWTLFQTIQGDMGDNDQFGGTAAMNADGTVIAMGAWFASVNGAESGATYAFQV